MGGWGGLVASVSQSAPCMVNLFCHVFVFVYLFGLLLRGELIMWWREGAEDRRTS